MEPLVIESLRLLGFSSDEYKVPVLSPQSFAPAVNEKVRERTLLSVLHFLLSTSLRDKTESSLSFQNSVQDCFPYKSIKEKVQFRKVVQEHLQGFVDRGELPAAATRSSTLMTAEGPSIWEILWTLSDLALDSGDTDAQATHQKQTPAKYKEDIATVCRDIYRAQKDRAEYSIELERRLGTAVRSIERSKGIIKAAVKQDTAGSLTQGGKLVRTEQMVRINGTTLVVKDMLANLSRLSGPARGGDGGWCRPMEETIDALLMALEAVDPDQTSTMVQQSIEAVNTVARSAEELREDSQHLGQTMEQLIRELASQKSVKTK